MSAEIVERALALSSADQAVVIATESSTVNLRWANNTLTTNGSTRSRSVQVISIIGRSFGVRAATSVSDGELEELVRASEADARSAGDAEDYEPLVSGDSGKDFEAPAEYTSTAVFDAFAADLGEAMRRSKSDGESLFGFAMHDITTLWLGTSTGLRLRHTQPTGTVDWTAKNGRPGGSVWHGQGTRDFTDVSVTDTHELLRKRLAWTERSIDLAPGRYETLLPPSAIADLLIYAYWSAAGRDAAEGRTAFSRPGGGTRVGERLGVAGLNLYSDPLDPELPAAPFVIAGQSSSSSSVFDNGLPLSRTDWIEDGVLTSLLETRFTAKTRSVPVTPAIDNLLLDAGGTASLDEMVASTKSGLLVTCLWYIREVNPQRLLLTGLTRDGVYKVEDGEVVGAVNNFRFNESPLELLGRLTESGASVRTLPREWSDYFTSVRTPPVRVADFNMSTVSPAS